MTTPFDAFFGDMDKQALDPLSMGAALGLGHVATNAVIKARNAVGDAVSLGGRTMGPRQTVADAVHHALEGRIATPARREAHRLALGPEVQAQEYGLPHAVTTHYLQRAGGDKAKAIQMMKATVGTPEFGKAVAGYAPSEHLAAVIRGLPDNPAALGPAHGTVAFKPGTRGYQANEAAGRTLAQGAAVGLGAVNPHLAAIPLLNKGKDLLNRYTPFGAAIAARQVGKGLQAGPSTGLARHATDLLASPGMTHMRDAGAVVGRGIDKAAPPAVATDLKRRVGETLQSPQGLARTAEALHGAQQAVAAGKPPAAVGHAKDFYTHLAPESQQAMREAGTAFGRAAGRQGAKIVQQPKVQQHIEQVYHAAAGGFDARRAAGQTGKELGRGVANDVLDATVNKKLPGDFAVRVPSPEDVAAGRAAFMGHPGPAEAPKTGLEHLAVPAAAGAAAVGAGYAMHRQGEQDPYAYDPYGFKAASADDFLAGLRPWAKAAGALEEELAVYPAHATEDDAAALSLGRFEAVPQPLRIRAKEVNVARVLAPVEALHRIMASKNHQHHLARRAPGERLRFMEGFRQRWVGDEPYHLVDLDLGKLRARPFTLDEKKVDSLVASPPPDDGNHPIIGRYDGKSGHPHVVLDGNHRVEALRRRGEARMKAYVPASLVPELAARAKAAVSMERDEYLAEHKRLIHRLEHGSRHELHAEAVAQEHEIRDELGSKAEHFVEGKTKSAALITAADLDGFAERAYARRPAHLAHLDRKGFSDWQWMKTMHDQEPDIFPHPDLDKGAALAYLATKQGQGVADHVARLAGDGPVTFENVRTAWLAKGRTKAAFSITVPVDLAARTPSPFPEDFEGHILTSLRANSAGQPELAMLLAAMRGHEGTPAANAALVHYIAGPHLAGLVRR